MSGKTPVSICLFSVSALLKSTLKARGCPLKGQKTALCGQQSHFWNHHRSHGLLTFPQSSSGERCFHWTSQGGGCRKVVGTGHPGTPLSPEATPQKQFTADRREHSLFKCSQGTDRTPSEQSEMVRSRFFFTAQGRGKKLNRLNCKMPQDCHGQKYLILIKAKSIKPQSIARMNDIGT